MPSGAPRGHVPIGQATISAQSSCQVPSRFIWPPSGVKIRLTLARRLSLPFAPTQFPKKTSQGLPPMTRHGWGLPGQGGTSGAFDSGKTKSVSSTASRRRGRVAIRCRGTPRRAPLLLGTSDHYATALALKSADAGPGDAVRAVRRRASSDGAGCGWWSPVTQRLRDAVECFADEPAKIPVSMALVREAARLLSRQPPRLGRTLLAESAPNARSKSRRRGPRRLKRGPQELRARHRSRARLPTGAK